MPIQVKVLQLSPGIVYRENKWDLLEMPHRKLQVIRAHWPPLILYFNGRKCFCEHIWCLPVENDKKQTTTRKTHFESFKADFDTSHQRVFSK